MRTLLSTPRRNRNISGPRAITPRPPRTTPDTYQPSTPTGKPRDLKKMALWAVAGGVGLATAAALLPGLGVAAGIALGLGGAVGGAMVADGALSGEYQPPQSKDLWDPTNPNNPIFWEPN